MACLTLTVTQLPQSLMTVDVMTGADLVVTQDAAAALMVEAVEQAQLNAVPDEHATLSMDTLEGAQLEVGEVCVVSGGTLVVLAGSDGPLRTRDGGYFLLNPETNPAE